MKTYYVGVDVGGTKTAFGLFDENHEIITRYEQPTITDGSCEDICQAVADGIFKLTGSSGLSISDIAGVGLAFPSFINFETGRIICTSNICNLKEFDARDFFSAKLGVRVALDNDSHAAAIAEHRFGAGRGFKDMLYCAVSTGIANGIIINNNLFRGSYGAAGETGHMLITPDEGVTCGCGNRGCFMSHTSGSMIVRHIRQWLAEGETSSMVGMAGGDPSAINGKILQAAAEAGDPMALRAIEKMAYYLGVWTFNLYQAFNINCYVFGGGLVKMGDLLFDRVRYHFDRFNVSSANNPVYFKYAELGRDFGIIGAEQLLFE
ncbi:MAG: ROK family protein [Eubacteriales bacterium]